MKKQNRRINKKAQIFTLVVIILLALVFVTFEISNIFQDRISIKTRVSSMDSFRYSVEENLQRQMYISGFRVIFLMEDEILKNGEYVSDVNSFFNEAFFQGTVNGVKKEILTDATYDKIIESINEKASKINVNITFSNPVITISQSDPRNIKVTLTANFSMGDKANLAKWNKQQEISAFIPIENFEDPFFVVNTQARVSRKINFTVYEGNYVRGNNVTNLNSHIVQGLYAPNSNAPSFLNRLGGNFSGDLNGIESFVNLNEMQQPGIPLKDKSCVDYIYFSNSNPASYKVQGMPGWFKIDDSDNHLEKYNVSGLTISP